MRTISACPALLAALVIGTTARPGSAQDATGVVEYVAGGTLYIGVASGTRWIPGDTIHAALLRAAEWRGQARVLGANENRLALEWLTGATPFSVGDSLRLELLRARIDSVARPPEPAAAPAEAAAARQSPNVAGGGTPGPRFSGRLGIELDAARSSAPWEGRAVDNTSLLPSVRLRGVLTGLPGDLRIRANVRASYRHDDNGVLSPAALLFANELDLERTGGRMQLRLGRFANPYEPYSSYWDGALLRVGREDGVGIGAVYGFQPRYGNQAFGSDRPRATAFIDVHRYTASWRYDGDVSLHRHWERDSAAGTAIGWSQQLGVGRLRVTQLLRLDDSPGGWVLGLAQFAAAAPLSPNTRLRLRFTRDDPHGFYGLPAATAWRSDRVGAALSWFGSVANAGVDVGSAWRRREGVADVTARTIAGWVDVPRTPVAGLGLDLGASRWSEGDQRSFLVAPGVRHAFHGGLVRAGYEFYHYDLRGDSDDTHTVSGAFSQLFGRSAFDLQLRHDWGPIRNTRALASFWVTL